VESLQVRYTPRNNLNDSEDDVTHTVVHVDQSGMSLMAVFSSRCTFVDNCSIIYVKQCYTAARFVEFQLRRVHLRQVHVPRRWCHCLVDRLNKYTRINLIGGRG